MLGPYRDPGLVDADFLPEPLPDRCHPVPQGCSYRPPPTVLLAPRASLGRTFWAPFTMQLLGSVSLVAITWMVSSVVAESHARRERGSAAQLAAIQASLPAAVAPAPRAAARHVAPQRSEPAPWDRERPSRLGTLSEEPHHVGSLWRRAEALAANGGGLTLVRVTAVRGAMAHAIDTLVWLPRRGGLHVSDIDKGAQASLLGLRRGDLVTGINGFALGRPGDATFAQAALGASSVVELVRDGKEVALRIDWTE